MMIDEVHFRSPMGLIGVMVDYLFMAGYLRRMLANRGIAIKREAEAGVK